MVLQEDLNDEFKNFLNEITIDLFDNVSSNFYFFNNDINITNFYCFEKSISDLNEQEKIDLFINRIDSKESEFLVEIFNFIEEKKYKSNFLIDTVLPMNIDETNHASKIALQCSETINEFDIITCVKDPWVSWVDPNNPEQKEEMLYNFSLFIDHFNNFNNKLYLKGEFMPDYDTGCVLDHFFYYCDLYLNCDLHIIKNHNEKHDFLIYLIESFSYLENHNYKMFLFHLYSSFDGFIQKLYQTIFSFYVENYTYYINKLEDNFNEFLSDFELSSNAKCFYIEKFKNKLAIHLKNKIKLFSNDVKKLERKLSTIMFELGIKTKNKSGKGEYKYDNLSKAVKLFQEISDYRNDISHADAYVDFNRDFTLKVFYNILLLMCAISTDQNLIDLFY